MEEGEEDGNDVVGQPEQPVEEEVVSTYFFHKILRIIIFF